MDYVLKGMKRNWKKPVKHADAFTEGVSDLSAWMEGVGTVWIETKAADRWPVRENTPVKFGAEYTEAQRDFTEQRRGWILIRVAREYFLFDWGYAKWFQTSSPTQQGIRRRAYRTWRGFINWEEFAACLKFHP